MTKKGKPTDARNVQHSREGAVARVEIAREAHGNSIDRATASALLEILEGIGMDYGTSALVIASSGTRIFCAGGDVKEYAQLNRAQLADQFQMMTEVCRVIERLPVPVIAAVSGAAVGGGVELALACDIRVASKEAWFQFPNVGYGLITAWGGGKRLLDAVGRSRALEMMLLGRRIGAEEARHLGLIDAVVKEPNQLAMRWAHSISEAPREVLTAAKAHLTPGGMTEEDAARTMLDLWFEHGTIRAEGQV